MKIKIELLNAYNYFAGSNDVVVMLKGKCLLTYDETPLHNALMSKTGGGELTDDHAREENMARLPHGTIDERRKKARKRDLALAYILNSINNP